MNFTFVAVLLLFVKPFLAQPSIPTTENPPGVFAVAEFPQAGSSPDTKGYIIFTSTNGVSTNVHVDFIGLPAEKGPFAYHIHELAVGVDGNCAGTGAIFNPYGSASECPRDDAYECAVGNLAGKHGKMEGSCFEADYVDPFLSLNPTSNNFVVGRAIVIHSADRVPIACATVQVAGDEQLDRIRLYAQQRVLAKQDDEDSDEDEASEAADKHVPEPPNTPVLITTVGAVSTLLDSQTITLTETRTEFVTVKEESATITTTKTEIGGTSTETTTVTASGNIGTTTETTTEIGTTTEIETTTEIATEIFTVTQTQKPTKSIEEVSDSSLEETRSVATTIKEVDTKLAPYGKPTSDPKFEPTPKPTAEPTPEPKMEPVSDTKAKPTTGPKVETESESTPIGSPTKSAASLISQPPVTTTPEKKPFTTPGKRTQSERTSTTLSETVDPNGEPSGTHNKNVRFESPPLNILENLNATWSHNWSNGSHAGNPRNSGGASNIIRASVVVAMAAVLGYFV